MLDRKSKGSFSGLPSYLVVNEHISPGLNAPDLA